MSLSTVIPECYNYSMPDRMIISESSPQNITLQTHLLGRMGYIPLLQATASSHSEIPTARFRPFYVETIHDSVHTSVPSSHFISPSIQNLSMEFGSSENLTSHGEIRSL